jgi:hypothetical protein
MFLNGRTALQKKFHALGMKDEEGVLLAWYAWPHDQSEEGIVMSITGNENIATDTANIISLYGVVSGNVAIFKHEPNHAWPHGFFTVCIDSADINESALDSFTPQNGPSPHP